MHTLVELIYVWGMSAAVLLTPSGLVVIWALNRSWSRRKEESASTSLPAVETTDRAPSTVFSKAA